MISKFMHYDGTTEYRGNSNDIKPIAPEAKNGDKFVEMDGGKQFLYDAENDNWEEQPKKGGGAGYAYTADEIANNTAPSGDVTFHISEIGNSALRQKSRITSAKGATVTNVGSTAFQYSSLQSVFFPNTTIISQDAFSYCTSLATAIIGGIGTAKFAFRFDTALKAVDASATNLPSETFSGCSILDTLVLRQSTICTLGNINAFNNTPFASGGSGGTLYVPSALIADYQAATNWSTVLGYANNSIAAIEGSIYETQYADGTPIPTT